MAICVACFLEATTEERIVGALTRVGQPLESSKSHPDCFIMQYVCEELSKELT